MREKGVLISIEGIDGAGKTTHVELLKKWFESKGKKVKTLKEPTQGIYGREIAELASKKTLSPEKELELFILDRKEDVKDNIKPALNSGTIVIMDRYYHSNIAYQAARGLDFKNIMEVNEEFAPRPELIIVLEVNPEVGMKRVSARKNTVEHFENLVFLTKVSDCFETIGKMQNAVLIDSNQPVIEVQKTIENAIISKLPHIFEN